MNHRIPKIQLGSDKVTKRNVGSPILRDTSADYFASHLPLRVCALFIGLYPSQLFSRFIKELRRSAFKNIVRVPASVPISKWSLRRVVTVLTASPS